MLQQNIVNMLCLYLHNTQIEEASSERHKKDKDEKRGKKAARNTNQCPSALISVFYFILFLKMKIIEN